MDLTLFEGNLRPQDHKGKKFKKISLSFSLELQKMDDYALVCKEKDFRAYWTKR